MTFSKQVWDQLKGKSCEDLIRALEKDGWVFDGGRGAERVYRHPSGKRITIHYHPGRSYRPKLLRALLADTGWSEDDMRRLTLIR